jgi:hypothetical protein
MTCAGALRRNGLNFASPEKEKNLGGAKVKNRIPNYSAFRQAHGTMQSAQPEDKAPVGGSSDFRTTKTGFPPESPEN